MANETKLFGLVLEGICYGILGTAFVLPIFLFLQDYPKISNSTGINFPDDSIQINIGLAWLLLGLSISAIFWSLVFKKNTNRFFLKWFLVLISSSIMPILMQMTFLNFYSNNNSWELIGIWWVINLFLPLVPFTFLFANRHPIIEKIQNRRNAVK